MSQTALWNNIKEFGLNCSVPWLTMGDFNVLKFDEKCNGVDVAPYEVKDFKNCCPDVGLTDVRSIRYFYTWTNKSIWSKLDRVMVNDVWVQTRFISLAEFLPLGFLFDHSPCIIALFARDGSKSKSYRFLNMWTNCENFHDLVLNCWN